MTSSGGAEEADWHTIKKVSFLSLRGKKQDKEEKDGNNLTMLVSGYQHKVKTWDLKLLRSKRSNIQLMTETAIIG